MCLPVIWLARVFMQSLTPAFQTGFVFTLIPYVVGCLSHLNPVFFSWKRGRAREILVVLIGILSRLIAGLCLSPPKPALPGFYLVIARVCHESRVIGCVSVNIVYRETVEEDIYVKNTQSVRIIFTHHNQKALRAILVNRLCGFLTHE